MRTFVKAALLLALAVPAGCGGGDSGAVTDPSQLPPLTEEQKAEIQKQDAQIQDEEQAGAVVPQ